MRRIGLGIVGILAIALLVIAYQPAQAGPPVSAGAPYAPTAGATFISPPSTAPEPGEGLNISGGLAAGYADSLGSGSPTIEFDDVGLDAALVYHTKAIYGVWPGITLTGEVFWSSYESEDHMYEGQTKSGPGGFYISHGNHVNAKFEQSAVILSADLCPESLTQRRGPKRCWRVGPRLQAISWDDKFQVVNTSTSQILPDATKNDFMLGGGIFGEIDFGCMLGQGNGKLLAPGGAVKPLFRFAATLGQGSSFRYNGFDVGMRFDFNMLEGLSEKLSDSPIQPILRADMGYYYWDIKQTDADEDTLYGGYETAAHYRLMGVVGQAGLVLAF
jgi:hypothetical protein